MLNFQSCLAQPIQSFIELRCLSGTDYKTQSELLKMFDKFLVEHEVTQKRITRDVTDQYKQTLQQQTLVPELCGLKNHIGVTLESLS